MAVEPQHGRLVVAGHSQELLPVAGFPLALLELHHKLCRERGSEAVRGLWALILAAHREDIKKEASPKRVVVITGSGRESQEAGGGPKNEYEQDYDWSAQNVCLATVKKRCGGYVC